MHRFTFIKATAIACCLVACSSTLMAQQGIPLVTLGEHSITSEDLRADFLRLPEEARAPALKNPVLVSQAASNLVLRKALAAKAIAEGLDKNPLVQVQLNLLTDRLLSDAWLAEVDKNNQPKEAEVLRLAEFKYKEDAATRFKTLRKIKASHILFEKSEAGQALAAGTLEKLRQGGDFSALAKELSKDPGSAARGGSLGEIAPGRMVPPFEQAAFALHKAGDISPVIESGFGYHVIRLDENIPESTVPFEKVKDTLMNEVAVKVLLDARNKATAAEIPRIKVSAEAVKQFTEASQAPLAR